MTEEKDWSLKDKLYYPTYKHEGELHYKEEDIETLRQKLIEDIKNNENDWLTKGSVDLDDECIKALIEIINCRFRGE